MSRACLAVLVTALLLGSPLAVAIVPLPPEAAHADDDGGTSIRALIDDEPSGTWREFPVSDTGFAAYTDRLAANGVFVDPVVYGAELREVGAYVHSWEREGTPYVTLGVYFVSDSNGKVRAPVAIVENVTDLGAMAMFVASLVDDDAMPLAAEATPHVYGLVAPDVLISGVVAGIAAILAGTLAFTVVETVANVDNGNSAFNLPPEAYPVLRDMSGTLIAMGGPLVMGQFGVGGVYQSGTSPEHTLTNDWTDRPEVRVWFARKTAADHDVWTGVAVSRTGAAEGDGIYHWTAWKRLSIGPVARVDGEILAPAAVYVRADVSRDYDDNNDGVGNEATSIENHYVLTAGLTTQGADTPLAQIHMDETRDDSVDENYPDDGDGPFADEGEATYLPESQQEDWSAGVVAAGSYTPIVGARTQSWHHGHEDVTNLGDPIYEWESERLSSAGVYVAGEYVPLVGARAWTERAPIEIFAATLALDGLGSQIAGDAQTSVGTFVDGAYVPLAGARYDDDFDMHLYDMRGMASAGVFVDGAFQPIAGATYDGEVASTGWALGRAGGTREGSARWQTSAGTFTLGFYRPIVGARFVPATHDAAGPAQESYQLGFYPLLYDPFIPVLSLDYAGSATSPMWAIALVNGQIGGEREGPWHADLVAYTPGPFAFPLVGARYSPTSPDGERAYRSHALVGVWGLDGFVPLVGASYDGDASAVGVAASMVGIVTGAGHANGAVSAGVYDPTTGAYSPVVTADTASVPL